MDKKKFIQLMRNQDFHQIRFIFLAERLRFPFLPHETDYWFILLSQHFQMDTTSARNIVIKYYEKKFQVESWYNADNTLHLYGSNIEG